MPQVEALTEIELAERAGTTPDRIRRLTGLGILAPSEGGSGFGTADVARVVLADAIEASGISLEDVGRAIAGGALSFAFLDLQSVYGWPGMSGRTYREACAAHGISLEFVRRVHEVLGFTVPEAEDRIREDDEEILPPAVAAVRAAGLSEDEAVRALRVYGENIRRIAQAEAQFYHTYIETPLVGSGMPERQMRELASQMSVSLQPLVERLVLWLYRRNQQHFIVEDLIEHVEAALDQAGVAPRRPARPPAMVFLDIAGYTRLTEERGDEAAAELASTLAGLVQSAARRHDGRPVKWLGDGVMFHFPDAAGAVRCSLQMVAAAPAVGLPPAHVGINAGPVIVREGDYFGRTVNVAARVAAKAGPGEVLVSQAVVAESPAGSFRFDPLGPVELKGVSAPVELFRARVVEDKQGSSVVPG
jgi:adenylate cyclase